MPPDTAQVIVGVCTEVVYAGLIAYAYVLARRGRANEVPRRFHFYSLAIGAAVSLWMGLSVFHRVYLELAKYGQEDHVGEILLGAPWATLWPLVEGLVVGALTALICWRVKPPPQAPPTE